MFPDPLIKLYLKVFSKESWYDYVTGIDYRGCGVNVVEYEEKGTWKFKKGKKKGETEEIQKRFLFLTNLPVNRRNVEGVVERGRMRWEIENEGFNTQKRQGYHLEHQYSKNYQAIKNHYYLIQIGHMIAQLLEAWEKIWEGIMSPRGSVRFNARNNEINRTQNIIVFL